MRGRWGETPFAALTACLAVGIAASTLLRQYCFAALAFAACALACSAILALIRSRFGLCLYLALCAIALGGVLLGLAERDGYARDDIRSLLAYGSLPLGERVQLDGCALEDSSQRGPDMVTTVELHGLGHKDSWVSCRGKVQLRVAVPGDPPIPGSTLRYGDRVRTWAECDVPRNFQNPGSTDRVGLLARRGIYLLARVKSPRLLEVLPQDFGTPWDRATTVVRRSIHGQLTRLGQEGNRQRAAVLSSIVLGDYVELSAETRAEFQNAGTYHVLVVSGLHVSTIAWLLIHGLRLLRVPPPATRLLAALGILFFTCLVGFQASITRALWMFTLYLIGQSLFRRAAPANTVLACAFLLLSIHPGWLQDAGFQLSFLSVAAIAMMGLPIIELVLRPMLDPLRHAGNPERLALQTGKWHFRGRRLRFRAEVFAEACADGAHSGLERVAMASFHWAAALGFMIGSMILISLSVQVWLEPVLAFYFNRLSWVAPVANLAIVPLSSLVLAAGMTAEALMSLTPSAWPAFRIAGLCASLLLGVNRWFSALPGAWQRCPTPSGLWVISGVLMVFFGSFLRWRRLWIPCAFVGLEIATLSLTELRLLPQADSAILPIACAARAGKARTLRLSFLDVGQGDSLAIQFPDTRVWVIDAGGLRVDSSKPEDESPFDIGEAVVSRFLWSRWIVALDRAVLTHPHQDHAGGMPVLLQNFPTGRLDYGDADNEPVQAHVLEAARNAHVPIHPVRRGEEYHVAGVVVRTLSPAGDRPARSLNDVSVVLQLEFGHFSAILTGDMEGTGEAAVLSSTQELHSQLLKVAHHGSRNATLDPFLDRVRPRWAVISAGRRNPFQNPSPETLLRLLHHGARLLLTMDQGTIFFETDGTSYTLSSHALGILEQGVLDSRPSAVR
ncbi:MAG: ComEC/Rec2 family competence protein [Acidobacteriota bacterium]|jgi:competence protein ComEC